MEFNPNAPTDPDSVFTPDYWAPSHTPYSGERISTWVPIKTVRAAGVEVAQLAFRVISGEIKGAQVANGAVFDPGDEDLARTSVHNFPGTILLGDAERFFPRVNTRKQKIEVVRDLEKEELERSKIDSSPRALMRSSIADRGDGAEIAGYAGRITYHSEDGLYTYVRKVNILYIATTRKGKGSLLEPMQLERRRHLDGREQARAYLMAAIGWRAGPVGQTQTRYSDDGEFIYADRLRSLEILASGSPAQAKQKNLIARALGSASTA